MRVTKQFSGVRANGTPFAARTGITIFAALDEPGDTVRFTFDVYGWYTADRSDLLSSTRLLHV